jgi:hypothetical protein
MALQAELMNEFSGTLQKDNVFSLRMRPYLIDEPDSDTTYICWQSGSDAVFLLKIATSGTVTTTSYAYDTWANRATASYSAIQ